MGATGAPPIAPAASAAGAGAGEGDCPGRMKAVCMFCRAATSACCVLLLELLPLEVAAGAWRRWR